MAPGSDTTVTGPVPTVMRDHCLTVRRHFADEAARLQAAMPSASTFNLAWSIDVLPASTFVSVLGGLALAFELISPDGDIAVQFAPALVGDTIAADQVTGIVPVTFGTASTAFVVVSTTFVTKVPATTATCTDTLADLVNPIAIATGFSVGGMQLGQADQPVT